MREMNKPRYIARKDVDRAMFWYEVRLYIKVALIVGIPTGLMIWAIMSHT